MANTRSTPGACAKPTVRATWPQSARVSDSGSRLVPTQYTSAAQIAHSARAATVPKISPRRPAPAPSPAATELITTTPIACVSAFVSRSTSS